MGKVFRVVQYVASGILVLLSGLILAQVVLRNGLNIGFSWVEEMARYLLLTLVLITIPVVFFYNEHVRVDLLSSKLKPDFRKIHGRTVVLLTGFFFRRLCHQSPEVHGADG